MKYVKNKMVSGIVNLAFKKYKLKNYFINSIILFLCKKYIFFSILRILFLNSTKNIGIDLLISIFKYFILY